VDAFVDGPTVTGGRLQGLSNLTNNLTLTYGSDWFYALRGSRGKSVNGGKRIQVGPQAHQRDIGFFTLTAWQALDTLRLDASLRYDHVRTGLDASFIKDPTTRKLFEGAGDTENNPVTGGIGAVWNVTDMADIYSHISTAFRAPSATEVAAVGTGVFARFRIPNPDIEPERAVNYEAGLRLHWPRVRAHLTGYVEDLSNLIVRNVPVTYRGIDALQIQNIGAARVSGIEAAVHWLPADDWLIRANATYTRGEDTVRHRPLPQIPPLNGFLDVRWEPSDSYYIEATLNWSLKHSRIDPTQERETDGYAVFGLYAGYELDRIWTQLPQTTLRLSVTNLFDTTYRLPTTPEDIRYPRSPSNPLVELGRNVVIGVETRF
jgi:hemoglobin/transferrin/lactoferrin receptor protein